MEKAKCLQKEYEPRHDKTNKVSVRPAKTQVAEGPSFLHVDSEDSDQTGRMPRLIWVFAGRKLILLVLSCRGSCVRNLKLEDLLIAQ